MEPGFPFPCSKMGTQGARVAVHTRGCLQPAAMHTFNARVHVCIHARGGVAAIACLCMHAGVCLQPATMSVCMCVHACTCVCSQLP